MKQTVSYLSVFVACIVNLLWICPIQAQTEDMLDRKIYLSQTKGSIYQLLENVTQQSGVLFIYDSQIINNEKQVRIKKGNIPSEVLFMRSHKTGILPSGV